MIFIFFVYVFYLKNISTCHEHLLLFCSNQCPLLWKNTLPLVHVILDVLRAKNSPFPPPCLPAPPSMKVNTYHLDLASHMLSWKLNVCTYTLDGLGSCIIWWECQKKNLGNFFGFFFLEVLGVTLILGLCSFFGSSCVVFFFLILFQVISMPNVGLEHMTPRSRVIYSTY